MKTKIIPFDLETAKKNQAGEIDGRILTSQLGNKVRILCYDFINGTNKDYKLVCVITRNNSEYILAYKEDGSSCNTDEGTLVIEVPDNEPQFKPFDKVLVRYDEKMWWRCTIFSHYGNDSKFKYICSNGAWPYCIPYEGNQELVGTTNKPEK